MEFTKDTHIADVATTAPSTIKVFQQHGIDFCCGGHRPLADACAEHHLEVEALLNEIHGSMAMPSDERDWRNERLSDLVSYIQARFHEALRAEIPRLDAMVDKVLSRHGEHYPEMLSALQREFRHLRDELLAHMEKEDQILFPAIIDLERGRASAMGTWSWIDGPIEVMELEHAHAGAALAAMRDITGQYTCPPDACPTFQGLFYGLEQLEREMHVHVHLENNILFPRAAELALQHS